MTRPTTRPTSIGKSERPSVADPASNAVRPTRVAVVGIHGHGSTRVRNALALQEDGKCRLVAVADLRPPDAGTVGPDVEVFADLDALLAATDVDIGVVCTPIHTHRELAEAAMRAGADVLLEKPPVPTMAEFEQLLALCAETGRSCQIGFQSLGSQAISALSVAVAGGTFGVVRLISTRCAWIRSVDYFGRSRWAGHRQLDGIGCALGPRCRRRRRGRRQPGPAAGCRTADRPERCGRLRSGAGHHADLEPPSLPASRPHAGRLHRH